MKILLDLFLSLGTIAVGVVFVTLIGFLTVFILMAIWGKL